MMFKKDFVWGVASSAYQIEGRDAQDGGGKFFPELVTHYARGHRKGQ